MGARVCLWVCVCVSGSKLLLRVRGVAGLQLSFCFSTCRSCLHQLALGPPLPLPACASRETFLAYKLHWCSSQLPALPIKWFKCPNSPDEWTAALVTRSFSESYYRPTALLSDLICWSVY